MTRPHDPTAAADLARSFIAELDGATPPPGRIEVKVRGPGGMAKLTAIEAVLARAARIAAPRELVWVGAQGGAALVQLTAYDDQGRTILDRREMGPAGDA